MVFCNITEDFNINERAKPMIRKFLNPKILIFTILTLIILFFMPKILGLLMILFASFVIAAALNPFVNKIQNKVKNRAGAAVITVLSVFVALLALFLPIIITCIKEFELLFAILPQKLMNAYTFITNFKLYGHAVNDIIPLSQIAESSSDLAQNVVNQSVNITMALGQTVFVLIALTMFVYYILVDKVYLREKFIEFFPPEMKEKASFILHNITSKVGNYVRAQIVLMIAVGLMVAIVTTILGIDYPILLGLIAGILDLIPVLGPSIALITIVIVAFPLGIVKVVLAIILFLTSQQISNYVIKPFLFGKFMKLHPITILVSIFIAQQFLGIWGVILSPAIAATICVLVDELYLSPMNKKEKITSIEEIL
jgi:predicted PurR-regulated permease PerM